MSIGTLFRQREIVLVPFPYSDLTGSKQRPALIISNFTLGGEDKICCLITSQHIEEGVRIGENELVSGALPFESYVKPQRIFTIHEKIIKKRLCVVTEQFLTLVVRRLSDYLKSEGDSL